MYARTICTALCLAALAIGGEANDLRRLRAENAMLQKQVARLKAEIAKLKATLAQKNEPASQPAGEAATKPKPLSGESDLDAWLKSTVAKTGMTELQASQWQERNLDKAKAKVNKRARLTFRVHGIRPRSVSVSLGPGKGRKPTKIIEVQGRTAQDAGAYHVCVRFPSKQKDNLLRVSRLSTVVVTGKVMRLVAGNSASIAILMEGESLRVLSPAPTGKQAVKPPA